MAKNWNELKDKLENLLCPAGFGVYTVHTAGGRRAQLLKKIYGQEGDDQTYQKLWKESLVQLPLSSRACLLGVPSDCGGGILRGANWGPLFIRQYLWQSAEKLPAFDLGDIRVIPHLLHDKYLNVETIKNCQKALYNNHPKALEWPVSPLSICYEVARDFYRLFPAKALMALGGDHSVSYPLVKAWLEHKKNQKKKVAIIHFDAHTDLLEERLGIDLCFGSWAGQIVKEMEDKTLMLQIGIRSSGKDRNHWEKNSGVTQFWTSEVKKLGAQNIAQKIIQHLKSKAVEEIYISFDIDALDINYAGATGTPEKDGLDPHDPMLILQELYEHFPMTGADLVEVAPMTKPAEVQGLEPETTLMVASTLARFLIEALHNPKSS